MSIVKEFKEFAMRGNIVDMAVGIIIGSAFGKIISSVVSDVLMPPIGMAIGRVDVKDFKLVLQKAVPAVTEGGQVVKQVAANQADVEVGGFRQ